MMSLISDNMTLMSEIPCFDIPKTYIDARNHILISDNHTLMSRNQMLLPKNLIIMSDNHIDFRKTLC